MIIFKDPIKDLFLHSFMSLVREDNNKNNRVIWADFCEKPFSLHSGDAKYIPIQDGNFVR